MGLGQGLALIKVHGRAAAGWLAPWPGIPVPAHPFLASMASCRPSAAHSDIPQAAEDSSQGPALPRLAAAAAAPAPRPRTPATARHSPPAAKAAHTGELLVTVVGASDLQVWRVGVATAAGSSSFARLHLPATRTDHPHATTPRCRAGLRAVGAHGSVCYRHAQRPRAATHGNHADRHERWHLAAVERDAVRVGVQAGGSGWLQGGGGRACCTPPRQAGSPWRPAPAAAHPPAPRPHAAHYPSPPCPASCRCRCSTRWARREVGAGTSAVARPARGPAWLRGPASACGASPRCSRTLACPPLAPHLPACRTAPPPTTSLASARWMVGVPASVLNGQQYLAQLPTSSLPARAPVRPPPLRPPC